MPERIGGGRGASTRQVEVASGPSTALPAWAKYLLAFSLGALIASQVGLFAYNDVASQRDDATAVCLAATTTFGSSPAPQPTATATPGAASPTGTAPVPTPSVAPSLSPSVSPTPTVSISPASLVCPARSDRILNLLTVTYLVSLFGLAFALSQWVARRLAAFMYRRRTGRR